jgi:cyanophycinase
MRSKLSFFDLCLGAAALMSTACSGVEALPGESQAGARAEEVGQDSAPLAAHAAPVGRKLLIIGNIDGELIGQNSRDAIFTDRLIADVGGASRLRVLVVPAASASPAFLSGYLRSVLALRGVSANQIETARIANQDDDTTPNVDESTWLNGASERAEVAKVARANVVWFAGGDQDRATSLLLTGAGRDTPFITALRDKLKANDLIVAGYSAGAAVFSDPMIGNGTSFGALSLPPSTDPDCAESDPICVAQGLGFIPARFDVVVDQHFEERGRFARLVRALAVTNEHTGWGISANGGLYVDLLEKTAEVVGNPGDASVTIVGREGAGPNREHAGPPFLGEGYTISVLGTGDVYSLPSAAHPHGVASHRVLSEVYAPFSEFFDAPPVLTDSFGDEVLTQQVTQYFADGSPQASGARVDAIAFKVDERGDAAGFRFRFTADANSSVAWNEDEGYSIFDSRLKITTIKAQFTGLAP